VRMERRQRLERRPRPNVGRRPVGVRVRLIVFEALCEEVLADPAASVPEVEAVLVLAQRWGMETLKEFASRRLAGTVDG
jgi:hypothetical protein